MSFKSNGPGCCKCGGGGAGTAPVPSCTLCPAAPTTITFTANSGNGLGLPTSASLVYGPPPAAIASGFAGGFQGWFSTAEFSDFFADHYYLTMVCSGGNFYLDYSYVDFPGFSPGTNVATCVTWAIGSPNTCTPFSMSSPTYDTLHCGGGSLGGFDTYTLTG